MTCGRAVPNSGALVALAEAIVLGMLTAGGCIDFFDVLPLPEGVVLLDITDGPPAGQPGAPLFDRVATFSALLPASGDPTDVYLPYPLGLTDSDHSFPVALLLQGVNVHRENYSQFAAQLAAYGFIVVVPNHRGYFGLGLFANQQQLEDVLDFAAMENADPQSPLAGLVDTTTLVLIGHSFGGAAALNAIQDLCLPPFCFCGLARPPELRAAVVYGTDLKNPVFRGPIEPIDNAGLPVLVIRGSRDGLSNPEFARKTFEQVQHAPKALVTVEGANHYGITNRNNPPVAPPDPRPPTLPQDVATETIARWCAMFLRAHVLGDTDALDYVQATGDALDENVTVIHVP
jgi:predicted dienelactone hydrolase